MNTSHMPGIFAGSFLVPGGNGFPDLEVLPTDPADWVTMQIAARQKPDEQPQGGGVDPQGNILPGGKTAPTTFGEWAAGAGLKNTLQGLVIAGGMVLLAILLIVLGAYQFTKD